MSQGSATVRGMGHLLGSARVSTTDQQPQLQVDALERAGCYTRSVMTRAELRAGLDLLPTWALGQKAAASREVSAVMRQRLAAGEAVARMYQGRGLGWLERQAEVAEDWSLGGSRRARTA
jgi:hypothetical protein